MHKDLCIQLGAIANNPNFERECFILSGKIDLIEELIGQDLNLDTTIECEIFKLYNTHGIQLACEFPNDKNLSLHSAEKIALEFMEKKNIVETRLMMFNKGLLIASKNVFIKK